MNSVNIITSWNNELLLREFVAPLWHYIILNGYFKLWNITKCRPTNENNNEDSKVAQTLAAKISDNKWTPVNNIIASTQHVVTRNIRC